MYSNQFEHTIEPGCPWHSHQQFFGPPNVNWCEPTICSWINEPFNAWSNLGYLLIGLFIIFQAINSTEKKYGIVVVLTGLVSFIYHSTNNFFTQYFDYLGMLILVAYVLSFNISRLKKNLNLINFYLGWLLSFLLITLNVFLMMKIPIQLIIVFGCFSVVIFEFYNGYKEQSLKKYKYFLLSFSLITVGQIFAILDSKRIFCPNELLFTGHVLWHIFGSLGLGFYVIHIKKMDLKYKKD